MVESQRAERLDVASRLARGIARELVDLVTAIQGHASLVLEDLADDPRTKASAEAVRRATEQAAVVAHQLLALSGEQVLAPRAIDLNKTIASSLRLLGDVAGRATTIDLELDPLIPDVLVDPDQLDHVLVGLVAASRDRLGPDGRITLSTRAGTSGAGVPDVVLTVRDNGSTIPADQLDEIFEPFPGSGRSGDGNLWLATAHGILNQSGGSIRADTGQDGTTFTVRLPAHTAAPRSAAASSIEPLPRGTEWILVVEDEDGVRDFIERALERLGYHVTAVSTGEDALERVRGYFAEPIDLLVTDVVLPGMSGPELASTLGASRPGMPVLYVSGYASDVTAFHGLPGLADHVLAKPFGMDVLARRVRSILEERRRARRARRQPLGTRPPTPDRRRRLPAARVIGHNAHLVSGRLAEEEPMRTLITNGTIVTADGSYQADVLIDGETIAQIGRDPAGATVTADETIDATGKYVVPGGIDVHTHMELPFGGTFAKDTFETGSRAAAFGGTTTIIDFAVQTKGQALREGLDTWMAKAEGHTVADYAFHMIMSDVNDATLAEMDTLVAEGVPDFKLFTAYPGVFFSDDGAIFRAMQQTARNGGLIMMHAENGMAIDVVAQAAGRVRQDRSVSTTASPATRSFEGEATNRVIRLAEAAGAPVYIVHLSAKEALAEVRAARDRGSRVFAETCPAVPVPVARRPRQRLRGRQVRVLAAAPAQGPLGRALERPDQGRPAAGRHRPLPVRLPRPEGARSRRLPQGPQRPAGRRGPGRPAPRRRRRRRPDLEGALGRDHVDGAGEAVRPVPAKGRDRGRLRRRPAGLRPEPQADDLGGDSTTWTSTTRATRVASSRAPATSSCRAARSSSATGSSPAGRATAGSSSGRPPITPGSAEPMTPAATVRSIRIPSDVGRLAEVREMIRVGGHGRRGGSGVRRRSRPGRRRDGDQRDRPRPRRPARLGRGPASPREDDRLVVTIEDDAPTFDPTTVPEPDLNVPARAPAAGRDGRPSRPAVRRRDQPSTATRRRQHTDPGAEAGTAGRRRTGRWPWRPRSSRHRDACRSPSRARRRAGRVQLHGAHRSRPAGCTTRAPGTCCST